MPRSIWLIRCPQYILALTAISHRTSTQVFSIILVPLHGWHPWQGREHHLGYVPCTKPRIGKLWPAGQIRPTSWICKSLLEHSHTHLYLHCLWLLLYYDGQAVVTETIMAHKALNIYYLARYGKFAGPWSKPRVLVPSRDGMVIVYGSTHQ